MESSIEKVERQRTSDVAQFVPEHTLDYYVEKRGDNKRNYVFRYKGAQKCDHPRLDIIARGGNEYSCPDCNYTFQIGGVFVQPEHFGVISAAFKIMRFARRFGVDSLQEVWRRPIGQTDGTPHKPVLPEGMSFSDVLNELEAVPADATPDELAQLRDWLWVGPKERQLQLKDEEANKAQATAALEKGRHESDTEEVSSVQPEGDQTS